MVERSIPAFRLASRLFRSCPLVLLAVSAVAVGAAQSLAGEACKPQLSFKDVRFSEIRMHNWRRTWSAVLAADASRCATEGGRFDIAFVRLIEVGPDLPFTEQFTWRPGEFEVSAEFAFDEAVASYSIGYVAPCACREGPLR